MRERGNLVHRLRNITVRELIHALERDGFSFQRSTRTGSYIYRHPDERITIIHYHRGGNTLRRKTLASVLRSTEWDESDLRRLGLI